MTSHAEGLAPKTVLEMMCPYEPGKPIDEVRRELGLTHVIKLASNENPLGPSAKVIEALNQANLELHMYPDCDGWYLRAALSEHLSQPTERIVMGAGSAELMRLLADAFLEKDDEAIIADVCFPVYANVIYLAGARPVVVPLDPELNYDLEGMLRAVTPRTKAVFIASPNNPTGRLVPFRDLKSFVQRLPARVLCALDLAYWEYVDAAPDEDPMRFIEDHPNVVVLRTFSKVYGLAGLRVGYAVANPDVIEAICRVRIPFSTSTASQLAARVALRDPEHVARSRTINRSSLDRMRRGLTELGLAVVPSDANFLLVDIGHDSDTLFDPLLRKGIIVRPMHHPRIHQCVRITSGTQEQIERLLAVTQTTLSELAK